MRIEYFLLIKGFLLIFSGLLVLITCAFFPVFITNHLTYYSVFLVIIFAGLIMINIGKQLLNKI